jgi:hypothetical protein
MGYVTANHFRLGLARQRRQQELLERRTERVPSRLMHEIHQSVTPRGQKINVWVIGGEFLYEPNVDDMQIGEVCCLETGQFNVVAEYSYDEYEAMMDGGYGSNAIVACPECRGPYIVSDFLDKRGLRKCPHCNTANGIVCFSLIF